MRAFFNLAKSIAIGLRYERSKYAYGMFFLLSSYAAAAFQFIVIMDWSVVGPEFYGPFVYAIDLEFWTVVQGSGGLLGAIALWAIPGRAGAVLGLFAGLFLFTIFTILFILTGYAPVKNPMYVILMCIGMPLMSLISTACLLRLFHD